MRSTPGRILAAIALFVLSPGVFESNCARTFAADTKLLHQESRFRQPVALALVEQDRLLITANRRSGSVSIIDTKSGQVLNEIRVGQKLSGLAVLPGDRHLLTLDESAHQLIWLTRRGNKLTITGRLRLSPYPVTLQVTHDGRRCFVASLWSRTLTVVELARQSGNEGTLQPSIQKRIALPFPPRRQLLVRDDSTLIVADAFGGRLAVIDAATADALAVHELPAHNIRGLALGSHGKTLVISHQILNRLARTTGDDVHWGLLMTNNLRHLRIDAVLANDGTLLRTSRVSQLGDIGNATGDPESVAITADDRIVVALGGVGEVAVGREHKFGFQRVMVGRRPTAIRVSADAKLAYVANTLSDSVSVVDLARVQVRQTILLGPQPEHTAAELGEMLFYDARLSHDNWFSCHSCHTDGHSNGLRNDNLSDGTFGAPKRVLSLLGVADSGPWAWNGKVSKLETQIRKSIETTMQGALLPKEKVNALAAYLRTLAPPKLPHGPIAASAARSVQQGHKLFNSLDCQRCHRSPAYTSPAAYDVGIHDDAGNTHFNPPSLRAIGLRDSFFHDNRAHSLEDIFTRFKHQLDHTLSKDELRALVAFLRSL